MHTCPWWGFYDPFVQRILDAHLDWSKGQRPLGGAELPRWVDQGIKVYEHTLAVCRRDRNERESRAREAERRRKTARMPPGFVSEGAIKF